jgi:hypothetical protein
MIKIIQMKQLADEMLLEAQTIFGKKVNGWQFNNVEINDGFPHIKYYPNGFINISLTSRVLNDYNQLCYQLSHEVCHLLHPSKEFETGIDHNTLVINEGMATYFSILQMLKLNIHDEAIEGLRNNLPNYYNAFLAVNKLMSINPDSIKIIRNIEPTIDRLTIDDFTKTALDIPLNLKLELLNKFEH